MTRTLLHLHGYAHMTTRRFWLRVRNRTIWYAPIVAPWIVLAVVAAVVP